MNLEDSALHRTFRKEVGEFLAGWPLRGAEAELPDEEQARLFRERGIERGYVYRSIPAEYGGSGQPPDALKDHILQEEYMRANAPGGVFAVGPAMVAPTLIEWGTQEQKQRFVPPTLRGEMRWCQGYSEPGAGSDLASLQSRAEFREDHFVLNGHKIWTSAAREADYMFGLFRSEPEAQKHAGISYLLIDMKTPGIDVRPLKQMTGASEFNEVFFDDVRVPGENIVGRRGEGWKVSRSTLVHERNLIGDPNMLRGIFEKLVALARRTTRDGRPAIEDPHVRQRLSEIEGYVWTQETSGLRQLSASARGEEHKCVLPMMMNKLYSTDAAQRITKLAADLLGAEALWAPSEDEATMMIREMTDGAWAAEYMTAIANSIAGGASNIQRNIIGERCLGLPRDLRSEG